MDEDFEQQVDFADESFEQRVDELGGENLSQQTVEGTDQQESAGLMDNNVFADNVGQPQIHDDRAILAGIDVDVQFVVGTARITLAALRCLDDGSLIENSINRFYPKVVAQVNGREIAEGEFLDMDGQVGFRISKILV